MIKVISAELGGLERDLSYSDDQTEIRAALEICPGSVHFNLAGPDRRRVCADSQLGRRIVEALFMKGSD